jgi:hypothetical protein
MNLNNRMPYLKRFFKMRINLVAFIGSVIVFATFIVKEDLRDEWKDISDAVDVAQYMYSIRIDTGQEATRNQTLEDGIEGINRMLLERKDEKSQAEQSLNQYNYAGATQATARAVSLEQKVDALQILADKLPLDDENHRRMEQVRSAVARVKDLSAQTIKLVDESGKNDDIAVQKDSHYRESLYLMWAYARLTESGKMIDSVSRSVDDDAEELRLRNDVRASWAKWISTILYAGGIGLGLAAKIYGAGELNGAE